MADLVWLGGRFDLSQFIKCLSGKVDLSLSEGSRGRLDRDRSIVMTAAGGAAPVYGLNTGLGANLGHRVPEEKIAAFQYQILAGRAVAVGPVLSARVGRGVLLARLISAARGGSGISLEMMDHLMRVHAAGLAPAIPKHGSIGASDLTQNACWALAVLGQGQMWRNGVLIPADKALRAEGLTCPELAPKDAMVLINHAGLSVTRSAQALDKARRGWCMARACVLLSYLGYGANTAILRAEINALRPAPAQGEVAAWLAEALEGQAAQPRRVQEAISFRAAPAILGAAWDVLTRAEMIWEDEANGLTDSPVVLADDAMCSSPNFQAPALALSLENASQAMAMIGSGALQRCQRMMNPDLTALPRYLSPIGGASAGFVPIQKTAAALLSDIRRHAQPVFFDPSPVSDGVEDLAPMTPAIAGKLSEQCDSLMLLLGIEALIAAQAIDLRQITLTGAAERLHSAIRAKVPMLQEDRALGRDVEHVRDIVMDLAPDL